MRNYRFHTGAVLARTLLLETAEALVFTILLLPLVLWLLLPTRAHAQKMPPSQASTRSPHGKLNMACENCHTFTSWAPIRSLPDFNHSQTKYPLRGMHQQVTCVQCHTKLIFTNVSTKCADCHADIHRRQFGANCEQCHSVMGWKVSISAIRQHQNRFPLIGAHATASCESCHRSAGSGQFDRPSTQCIACHTTEFRSTKVLNHVALKFPASCESCHRLDAWPGARFDHARFTGFMLSGAHATLDCANCHVGGRYQGTRANCIGCHAKEFATVKNPDHVKAMFPTECSLCHTTSTWQGAKFDHATFARFPLTGMHATLACTQCHANGRFTGTPRDCASCHMAEFNKTTNPNHVAAGFPTDCSLCHSTSTWAGAKFDHARTGFALTGAHAPLQCASCHKPGSFTGLNPACVSCHLTQFNSTTNPNHVTSGFPQQCEVCHSTSAWTPAQFDHSRTGFPLTGMHARVQCVSCHINGRYAGTPADCYSCHRNEYNSTTSPNHAASAFPTNCAQCHTTTSWAGATFNHTWFPIYSGTHAGKWTTCADCHTNPGNFAVFSCTTCHAHDKTLMDQRHGGVRNYVYNSANCYACHPTGRGD